MADSETVVAQTSTVVGCTPAGHPPTGYADVSSNVSGALPSEAAGEISTSAVPTDVTYSASGGNLGDSNTVNVDSSSLMLESLVANSYETETSVGMIDSSGSVAAAGNEAMGSTRAAGAMGSTQAAGNEAVGSIQAAGYDSSVNRNTDSAVRTSVLTENGDVSDNVVGAVGAQQYLEGYALSDEEERLWNIVRANSFDFNAWTTLIDETEKAAENNILKIRKVYDAFLAEFPLCYGYWKKYADHEARMGNMDKVVEVYERAVQGVTYSVDIWLHYCIFSISTYGDPDTVRRLFDRGLTYVGSDYLSYPLWDKYIEYEYLQQDWGRLAVIYTRILENPNQQLDRHFNSFKELVANRPLSELKTAEEASVGAAVAGARSESSDLVNGGEVNSDAVDQSSKPVSAGLTEAEELEKYITIREEMYKKAKEFNSKIIGFETAIRRPYFHVRPLNAAELENWHNYLDFIEREGDFNKVVKLYERCLIACANYPEYWIRYVLCMEADGSLDLANNALARATQVFVKRQPEIHIFAARFKEQNEDISGACAAYQHVHSEISPGLLEAIIKHANMEKRLGNLEVACSLYEQAIAIEKGKEHSQTLSMLFAQYSRFVYLAFGNAEKAREILVEALEHVQLSKTLLEALIHFETIQSRSKQIDYIDSLVVKFIDSNSESSTIASIDDREELSCIFLEFLNLFGDAESIKKAEDRHAKFFLPHRSTSELKKRSAEDYLASDKTKIAKTYSGLGSPVHSLGAYPNAQNQWSAGCGVQPQGWPPATQAQGQQWTPGYAQQVAAYGAYGYATPQVPAPAPAPQSAAYATYPPTFPAQQTFPQQIYAQPAAATTLTPAQQPAAAAPAYYGSYY